MRLIDADELEKKNILHIRGEYGYSARSENWVMLVKDINNTPTVDPETLPIVQELRKQLDRVTAERDAAIANLKQAKSGCDFCRYTHGFSCDLEEPCIMRECWEWRGIE